MAEKILELEKQPDGGFSLHFRPQRLSLLPPDTRGHVLSAQKEMLLALRSIVDAAIASTEQAAKPKTKERTKIEVK